MNMSRIIINVVLIINYSGPLKTSGHGHGTQKPVALEDDLLDSWINSMGAEVRIGDQFGDQLGGPGHTCFCLQAWFDPQNPSVYEFTIMFPIQSLIWGVSPILREAVYC